jgi:hypothetical protein
LRKRLDDRQADRAKACNSNTNLTGLAHIRHG